MTTPQLFPPEVAKYFCGDNLEDLSTIKHKRYIIQTILDIGNIASISWLFKTYGANEIKTVLPKLKLSKKSETYWKAYFHEKLRLNE